jgi:sulfatase modifying factor 1
MRRSPSPVTRRASALALFGALAVSLTSSCDVAVSLAGLEGGCPPTRGALTVKVTSASGAYCIDSTETTNAQYERFFASGFALAADAIPAGCPPTIDPTPSNNWPYDPGDDDFPVDDVNWCQAYSFCAWAGKRLCGQIGGRALAPVNSTNAVFSQWFNACSKGGALTYPYGDTFASSTCGGQAAGSDRALVHSHPDCEGGFPGIFDMSGSVWEWTDVCASADPGAFCDTMGGAYDSTESELGCIGERNWTRSSAANNIGIRCCQDL